jgi:hypothetical protein
MVSLLFHFKYFGNGGIHQFLKDMMDGLDYAKLGLKHQKKFISPPIARRDKNMFLARYNLNIHGGHVAIIFIIFKVHMNILFIIKVIQDSFFLLNDHIGLFDYVDYLVLNGEQFLSM